jgi:hypothetical protein
VNLSLVGYALLGLLGLIGLLIFVAFFLSAYFHFQLFPLE